MNLYFKKMFDVFDDLTEDNLTTSSNPRDYDSLKSRPLNLNVFLNYTLSMTTETPNNLFFNLFTDELLNSNERNDLLIKWFYELHSTFLMQNAPLNIPIMNQELIKKIENALENFDASNQNIAHLRNLFMEAKKIAIEKVNQQINSYYDLVESGLSTLFTASDKSNKLSDQDQINDIYSKYIDNFIYREHQKIEDWNDIRPNQAQLSALISSFMTCFKRYVVTDKDFKRKTYFDKIPTFLEKKIRTKSVTGVLLKGHLFDEKYIPIKSKCCKCNNRFWGIGNQGLVCENSKCEFKIHRLCFKNSSGLADCSGINNENNNNEDEWMNWVIESEKDSYTLPINLPKRELELQGKIYEFVKCERTHLKNLKVIKHHFYFPTKKENLLSEKECKLLFQNLEELLEIHTKFNSTLEKFHNESINNELSTIDKKVYIYDLKKFLNILLDQFEGENGHTLAVAAAQFLADQQEAQFYIAKKAKNPDDKFGIFKQKAERHEVCRKLGLDFYLQSEMQTLTRYKLLLKEILKTVEKMDASENDRKKIEDCINASNKIVSYVNKSKAECENDKRVKEIQSKLDTFEFDEYSLKTSFMQSYIELNIGNRILLYEDVLELGFEGKESTDNKQQYLTLLFEDMLVFLNRVKRRVKSQQGEQIEESYNLKPIQFQIAKKNIFFTPIILLKYIKRLSETFNDGKSFHMAVYIDDLNESKAKLVATQSLFKLTANSNEKRTKWFEWFDLLDLINKSNTKTIPVDIEHESVVVSDLSSSRNQSISSLTTVTNNITEGHYLIDSCVSIVSSLAQTIINDKINLALEKKYLKEIVNLREKLDLLSKNYEILKQQSNRKSGFTELDSSWGNAENKHVSILTTTSSIDADADKNAFDDYNNFIDLDNSKDKSKISKTISENSLNSVLPRNKDSINLTNRQRTAVIITTFQEKKDQDEGVNKVVFRRNDQINTNGNASSIVKEKKTTYGDYLVQSAIKTNTPNQDRNSNLNGDSNKLEVCKLERPQKLPRPPHLKLENYIKAKQKLEENI